jgi:hypothetical protein
MKEAQTSETLESYHITTQCYNHPEDRDLNISVKTPILATRNGLHFIFV